MRSAPALAVAALVVLGGCSEKLTTPGQCPGLCPSDRAQVRDTVIPAQLDSSYRGFVTSADASSLLISNGLDGTAALGVVRFAAQIDSFLDTTAFRLDSVALGVTLQGRDSLVSNLGLQFYELDPGTVVDTTLTYAEASAQLTPDRLLGTVSIPDTLHRGFLRLLLSGADGSLSRIKFVRADSGIIRLAYRVTAPGATGLRIASATTGSSGPLLVTYRTSLLAPDTSSTRIRITPRIVIFDASVFDPARGPAAPGDSLSIGGAPSDRALLRFNLPAAIRDTGQIIRATLQLVPVAPALGLPGDTAYLDVRGLLADLGAKSPRSFLTGQTPRIPLFPGPADTLRVDVTAIARSWLGPSGATTPTALMAAIAPEGASFTSVIAGSSRSPAGFRPSLRLTYEMPYPFEAQ